MGQYLLSVHSVEDEDHEQPAPGDMQAYLAGGSSRSGSGISRSALAALAWPRPSAGSRRSPRSGHGAERVATVDAGTYLADAVHCFGSVVTTHGFVTADRIQTPVHLLRTGP